MFNKKGVFMYKINRNKGFSLLELLLVLGIIAALIIAAFIIFPKVQSAQRVDQEAKNISALQAGVKSLYASMPSYDTLSDDIVIKSKIAPDNMINEDGQLTNSFKGYVSVFGAIISMNSSASDGFQIVYNGVPPAECVKLVSAVGSNFPLIRIGENLVDVMNDGKLDVSLLANECSRHEYGIIYFLSY